MARRWIWLPGLTAAVLLLAAALAPGSASADRTVDLVLGCTPVALTHADGTDIATVAAGVQPANALVSIWKFLPAQASWSGYAAGAPAGVSDLQTVERLDALFVCANAVATITMPDI
jgi:hypothetical protein